MARFTAHLRRTGFYGAGTAMLPSNLQLTPVRWSASDRGGMKACTVDAAGDAQSLISLVGWMGDRLEIYNDGGDCVFWGFLWDLEMTIGNTVLALSMDNVYNRIAVIYPFTMPDGSSESRTTDWVEDADSILRYGKREYLYGLPEELDRSAESVRDTLLERFKAVSPQVTNQSGIQYSARLTGMGLWQKLATLYYNNPLGLVEHTGESGSVILGRYMESDEISFGESTPGGDADEMHIVTGSFDPLVIDDTFTISGSASNDDTYTMTGQDSGDDHQLTVGGSFTPEAIGELVRISYGSNVSYDRVAVFFKVPVGWTATHISLRVRKVGNPTDNLLVSLHLNSIPGPGTELRLVTTLGSTLFTEIGWQEFELPTPYLLADDTYYWIVVKRSGAANFSDGYEVSLDEQNESDPLETGARVFDGTDWVIRDPDADMPFRVIGEIASSEQMRLALDTVDDFSAVFVDLDSGIAVRQFSEDNRTVMDEMNDMLEVGTDDGSQLVAKVLQSDAVIVESAVQDAYGWAHPLLGLDGRVRYPSGAFYPPGKLIYGQYIKMQALALLDGMSVRPAAGQTIYIASSEYDAASDILIVKTESALSAWDALTTRPG